jgi:hypothetical protein
MVRWADGIKPRRKSRNAVIFSPLSPVEADKLYRC